MITISSGDKVYLDRLVQSDLMFRPTVNKSSVRAPYEIPATAIAKLLIKLFKNIWDLLKMGTAGVPARTMVLFGLHLSDTTFSRTL